MCRMATWAEAASGFAILALSSGAHAADLSSELKWSCYLGRSSGVAILHQQDGGAYPLDVKRRRPRCPDGAEGERRQQADQDRSFPTRRDGGVVVTRSPSDLARPESLARSLEQIRISLGCRATPALRQWWSGRLLAAFCSSIPNPFVQGSPRFSTVSASTTQVRQGPVLRWSGGTCAPPSGAFGGRGPLPSPRERTMNPDARGAHEGPRFTRTSCGTNRQSAGSSLMYLARASICSLESVFRNPGIGDFPREICSTTCSSVSDVPASLGPSAALRP